MKVHLMISAFGLLLLYQGVGAQVSRERNLDKYVDALVTAQFQYSYGCDGAADGTVLTIGTNNGIGSAYRKGYIKYVPLAKKRVSADWNQGTYWRDFAAR